MLALVVCLGALVGAQDAPSEEDLLFSADGIDKTLDAAPEVGPTAFGFGDLVRMVVVLIAVVGAIYGFVAVLKRFNRGSAPDDSSAIKILASKSLGGGKSVHAIQVGRSVYLLGTGDETVGLVAEISDAESIQELQLAQSESARGAETGFGARLASVFGSAGGSTSTTGGLDFIQRQRQRLRGL